MNSSEKQSIAGNWYDLKDWLDARQEKHPEFDSAKSVKMLKAYRLNYVWCGGDKTVFTNHKTEGPPINPLLGGQKVVYEVEVFTSSSHESDVESFLVASLTPRYYDDPISDHAHQEMSALIDEQYRPQSNRIIESYNKPWENTIREGSVTYIGIGVELDGDESKGGI